MRKKKEKTGPKYSTKAFERALRSSRTKRYTLRLYVAGMTPRSLRAIANVRNICEENLAGRFDLQVIDIYQQPTLAEGEQIIAAPTLIKKIPAPLRRFIGDMANKDRILIGLDIRHGHVPPKNPGKGLTSNENDEANEEEKTI